MTESVKQLSSVCLRCEVGLSTGAVLHSARKDNVSNGICLHTVPVYNVLLQASSGRKGRYQEMVAKLHGVWLQEWTP